MTAEVLDDDRAELEHIAVLQAFDAAQQLAVEQCAVAGAHIHDVPGVTAALDASVAPRNTVVEQHELVILVAAEPGHALHQLEPLALLLFLGVIDDDQAVALLLPRTGLVTFVTAAS